MEDNATKELMSAIGELEQVAWKVNQKVKKLSDMAISESEWLTTPEFAKETGLKRKTVSNYACKGKFNLIRKLENGKYQIHKSEIKRWG